MRNLGTNLHSNETYAPDESANSDLEIQMQKDWDELIGEHPLPESKRAGLLNRIIRQIKEDRRKNLLYQMLALAIIGVGILFYALDQSAAIIYDQQGTYILEDGTLVELAPQSRITMHEWAGKDHREVWLEGKATFNVLSSGDEVKRKFIVHSDEVDVEVYGTRFIVDAHEDLKVELVSGKVKLKDRTGNELSMKPGEAYTYSGSDKEFRKLVIPGREKEAVLVFDNTSLAEVVRRIRNEWDIKITIDDPGLLKKRFTGFADRKQINNFYRVLEEIFDARLVYDDLNNIHITVFADEVP